MFEFSINISLHVTKAVATNYYISKLKSLNFCFSTENFLLMFYIHVQSAGSPNIKQNTANPHPCSLWQHLSRLVGKPTIWFLNRSDTNRAAQAQKNAKGLIFWISRRGIVLSV